MSKPRYWWWGSIQAALRAYPRLKQRYEMPDVALTARYAEGVGHDSAPGRTTETAALQRLYDGDYKVYLAIKAARDQYGRMQPSEADVRIAFELLNYRSNDKSLLTIISSELSLDEIADIDEAIAGRIAQHAAGHCVTVAPDRGKNYRLKGVVSL